LDNTVFGTKKTLQFNNIVVRTPNIAVQSGLHSHTSWVETKGLCFIWHPLLRFS